MKVKELMKKLKTMSPDARVCVVRNEKYMLSDATGGIAEVEHDIESVIDLETRVNLEIDD